MSALTLAVTVEPGRSIDSAAQEAINLAHRLDINVSFDFNGTPCFATPYRSAADVMSAWERYRRAGSTAP